MADIELVIKIDENFYKTIKNNEFNVYDGRVYEMIRKGTPLPKGHGRLIDADKLMTDINTWCDCKEGICLLKDATTIVEADTEESEE